MLNNCEIPELVFLVMNLQTFLLLSLGQIYYHTSLCIESTRPYVIFSSKGNLFCLILFDWLLTLIMSALLVIVNQ